MSDDPVLDSISADIASGNTAGLSAKLLSIIESSDDPYHILKCMSMLKLVPQDGSESKACGRLLDVTKPEDRLPVAKALLNLECPYFSYQMLEGSTNSDQVCRVRCQSLYELEEYESALEEYGNISSPVFNDRILLSKIQSSLGEHRASIETAESLLKDAPNDYDVRIAYVNSLIMGGREKDAIKYSRDRLKDKSADSNAVIAYVLRIQGNVNAAGGYASRAVKLDNQHIGAMETLGICLAQKGEIDKARIVAGAINEISPGDRAAINVLSYCGQN